MPCGAGGRSWWGSDLNSVGLCGFDLVSTPLPDAHPAPQAAGREVERDFDSVYSRLVLCKTYR